MIIIKPLIDLAVTILGLYKFVLTIWIIMSWLVAFNLINTYHPFIRKVNEILSQLIEPVLAYLRKYIPPFGNVDLSSIALFLIIGFIQSVLIQI